MQYFDIAVAPDAVSGQIDANLLKAKDIPIWFHDVPGEFISPETNRKYLLVFNDDIDHGFSIR